MLNVRALVDLRVCAAGKGTLAVPGSKYEGEWKDDKRAGRGTKIWTNGRRYEGEWQNDEINGEGKWRWGDGRFYWGKFKSDCPLSGKLLDADGFAYAVSYAGNTDIADASLQPSTKARLNPADEQSLKDMVPLSLHPSLSLLPSCCSIHDFYESNMDVITNVDRDCSSRLRAYSSSLLA